MNAKKFFILFFGILAVVSNADAITYTNPALPFNPKSVTIGNYKDDLQIVDVVLGNLEPGSIVKYAWDMPSTTGLKYSLRYGCNTLPNLKNDNVAMLPLPNGIWAVPSNPGNNCYCKLWITAYNSANQIVGSANSRPVYICRNANKYGFRGKVEGQEGKDYKAGRIVIKFKKNYIDLGTKFGISSAQVLGKNLGLELYRTLPPANLAIFTFPPEKYPSVQAAYDAMAKMNAARIEIMEPDYFFAPTAIPNDPYFDSQWYLKKIQADKAWDIATGDDTIVAIIDSGLAYNEADFQGNLWDGSRGCKDPNGDTTTCPYHGWDPADVDNDPMVDLSLAPLFGNISEDEKIERTYHGTTMAALIGAVGNNSIETSGLNWKVKLMPIKVIGRNSIGGSYLVSDMVMGLYFAMNNGSKIINMSVGGKMSETLKEAFALIEQKGILVASAAGNMAQDASNLYPCAFSNSNNICVGGTDENDKLWTVTDDSGKVTFGSNYNAQKVLIGAPANNIIAVFPSKGSFATMGTSQSAALTAGLAALIKSANSKLSTLEIKNIILETGDDVGLQSKFLTGKRINAFKALQKAKQLLPNATTTIPTSSIPKIIVVTESANFLEKEKKVELKASVWGFKDRRDIEYAFYAVIKDSVSGKTIGTTFSSVSSTKPIVDGQSRTVSGFIRNLPELHSGQIFCAYPLAMDIKSKAVGKGEEICFPDLPWVRTNGKTIASSVFSMNGEITKYTGKKSISTSFIYYNDEQPDKKYETTLKKINYPSAKVFSHNLSYSADSSGNMKIAAAQQETITVKAGASFCYKACAVVDGSVLKICGKDVCYKNDATSGFSLKSIKIEAMPQGLRFVGNVSGLEKFSGMSATGKFFPDILRDFNAIISGGAITKNGDFSIEVPNIYFANNPKYCFQAGLNDGKAIRYAENESCFGTTTSK